MRKVTALLAAILILLSTTMVHADSCSKTKASCERPGAGRSFFNDLANIFRGDEDDK